MKLQGFFGQMGRLRAEGEHGKQPLELGKKFKVALQEKKPREVGGILGDMKALGPKAERAFLKTAVGERALVSGGSSTVSAGSSIAGELKVVGAGGSLKDAVFENFTPEQRCEVWKELSDRNVLGRQRDVLTEADRESRLAKFLAEFGKEKLTGIASPKDEMIRVGVGQVGGWISEGKLASRQPVEVAKQFKAALEQKDNKQLADLLVLARTSGVEGEKTFLSAMFGEGKASGASLKDSLQANLSPEQFNALAWETMNPVSPAVVRGNSPRIDVESMFSRFLTSFGEERTLKPGLPRGPIVITPLPTEVPGAGQNAFSGWLTGHRELNPNPPSVATPEDAVPVQQLLDQETKGPRDI